MICTNCNSVIADGSKFCPNCGQKIVVQKFCSNCGIALPPGAKFCPGCGTSIQGSSNIPNSGTQENSQKANTNASIYTPAEVEKLHRVLQSHISRFISKFSNGILTPYVKEGTDDTPSVVLDKGIGKFSIMGRSLPDDAIKFYGPILAWLEVYASKPLEKTIFEFKLKYFNTISSKLILEILLKLEDISSDGNDVLVRWHYPDDDEDIEEAGEEYSDIVDVPFEQVPYTI